MSGAAQAADEARCSVCQLRSIFVEQANRRDALVVQASLCAKIAETHGAGAKTKEAREMASHIAQEILRMYGDGRE
jgi:hypothetical protein